MRTALVGFLTLLAACSSTATHAQEADRAAANQSLAEIEGLLEGHADRQDERRVLEILEGLDPAGLDHVLQRLDLEALLSGVDDRAFGPDHYTALLKLLTQTRLADSSVTTRAALVGALQVGSTSAQDETAIRDVFLGTAGRALTQLKNTIDQGGDYRDVHQLLFHDVDDSDVRTEVLDHIAAQAALAPSGELKVLSDIDDTLYANWKDERYPSKTVYPGILALYEQLDLGPGEPGRAGDVVFVTARPGDRVGLVEDSTRETLRENGLQRATVLAGGFTDLTSNDAIAAGKFRNFQQLLQIYPEYRYVFLGDSGQGDATFGARMRAEHPEAVAAVFIHDVVATSAEARAEWLEQGVVLCDTYVAAACEAHALGLISLEGLRQVAAEAAARLPKIAFADDASRLARREELARDLERANSLLAPEQRVEVP